MKAKFVYESLNILNEKSFVRRASNKLHNINDALSELFDQMSQSDKNLKDKIFWQYYRFYNDGDIFKFPYETLKKLGMGEEGIRNLQTPFGYTASKRRESMRYSHIPDSSYQWVYGPYEKGLEEAVEVVSRYLLKKYGKKLNRQNLYLKKKKEIYQDIKDDDFNHHYWVKEYGKNFNIPELIEIANEIEEDNKKEKNFSKSNNPLKSLGIGKSSTIGRKSRIMEIIEDDIQKSKNKNI